MTKSQASSSSPERKQEKEASLKKALTARGKQASATQGIRKILLSAFLSDLSVNSSSADRIKRIPRPLRFEPLRFVVHYIQKFLQSHISLAGNIWPPVELWSKKQYDGGVERLIDLARKFRYQGIDLSHITTDFPTFTFYMDFNYTHLMQLTENLLSGIANDLHGSYKTLLHPNGINNHPVLLDFTPPFRRISMIDELDKIANLNIPRDFSSDATNTYLMDACTKYGIKCPPPHTIACLLYQLVEYFLKETCVTPTFIIDYPEIMSPPLAKRHKLKPGLTESFKLFINKHEICNGNAAFIDPVLYRESVLGQLKGCRSGDEGLMDLGKTSSTNFEYGLPPTGCWGLGIDRLAILFTDWQQIKDKDSKKSLL